MSESGVFDGRVAEHYDASRAFTDDSMDRLVRHLLDELVGRGPCLEIGVGTGLIALPLAVAGIPVTGVDASAQMLARLINKTGGRPPFGLARARAESLPFADGSFATALLFNVLHLMPNWKTALREAVRVVRRRGTIIVKHSGGFPAGREQHLREIRTRFHEEAGAAIESVPGAGDRGEVDGAMVTLGARPRALPTVVVRRTATAGQTVELCELGVNSSTADLPADVRVCAAAATRAWAARRFGGLDAVVHDEYEVSWAAYDLAWLTPL